MWLFFQDFVRDESGQGINEYAACIAFVSVLVALVFAISQGTLMAALSQGFSSVTNQIHLLNSASSAIGSGT